MLNRADKFWIKVNKEGPLPNPLDPLVRVKSSNCWEWVAGKTSAGYGMFWDGQKTVYAHRYALILFGVTLGQETDHLCRNRLCVNPEHLEVVTRKENTMRGRGKPAHAMKTNKCKYGHDLFGKNLRLTAEGWRVCRLCAARATKRNTSIKRDAKLNKQEVEALQNNKEEI